MKFKFFEIFSFVYFKLFARSKKVLDNDLCIIACLATVIQTDKGKACFHNQVHNLPVNEFTCMNYTARLLRLLISVHSIFQCYLC